MAGIRILRFDLAEVDTAKAAIEAAVQALGPPDILILSAGMTFPARWENVSMATFRTVVEINFLAWLSIIAQLAPMMASGSVIGLIGSAASLVGTYREAGYSPSKHVFHGLA